MMADGHFRWQIINKQKNHSTGHCDQSNLDLGLTDSQIIRVYLLTKAKVHVNYNGQW